MAYKMQSMSGAAAAADPDDDDFIPKHLRQNGKSRSLADRVPTSSRWSIRRILRWLMKESPSAAQNVPNEDRSAETEADAIPVEQEIEELRQNILGVGLLKHQKKGCWEWYQQRYLEGLRSRAWVRVLVPFINGLSPESQKNDPKSRFLFYRIVAQVAEFLLQKKTLTLLDMVQDLRSKEYIKPECGTDLAVQTIFQITGWLTTLWDPVLDTSTTHLSLHKSSRAVRRPVVLHYPTVTLHQLDIGESRTPLCRLLTRFGSLLPEPKHVSPANSRGDLEAGPENIDVSYLAFHHLKHDLKVRLEWTSTMNQHLELDSQRNVLYIYRFPSICRLMYHERQGSLLSLVYREYSATFEKEASPKIRTMLHDTEIEDFYAEVLLSFDLIFGRHRRSRALAKKLLADEAEVRRAEGFDDPLLEILCTKKSKSPEVRLIHSELDARDCEDYIELEKYPFLGERLINLQRRSMSRKTHSWRRLWNDDRNIGNWFIIWSVMIFGVSTIALGITQLIFQIFQIWPPHK